MFNTQQNIRRAWLVMLFLIPALQLCFVGFLGVSMSHIPSDLPQVYLESLTSTQNEWIGYFVLNLIALPILIRCSYKKQGTKLLFVSMWSGVAALVLFLFTFPIYSQTFKMWSALQSADNQLSRWISGSLLSIMLFGVVALSMRLFWSFCCYKLRRINLEVRLGELVESEMYRDIFLTLDEISELNALRDSYRKHLTEHPEIRTFLSIKYKKRKRELAF